MSWGWPEILGFIAGVLINAAFIPQVYRLFKLKSAREISLPFTSMLVAGGLFWLSYGILISSSSIVITNIVAVVLSALMLLAKILYGKTHIDEKHS